LVIGDANDVDDDDDDQGVRLEEKKVQRFLCQLRLPRPDCPDGEKAKSSLSQNICKKNPYLDNCVKAKPGDRHGVRAVWGFLPSFCPAATHEKVALHFFLLLSNYLFLKVCSARNREVDPEGALTEWKRCGRIL